VGAPWWGRVLIGRAVRHQGLLVCALSGPCHSIMPHGPSVYHARLGRPTGWSDDPSMTHMLVSCQAPPMHPKVVSCSDHVRMCVPHAGPFGPAQNYRIRV
jgi:hypothetical protein